MTHLQIYIIYARNKKMVGCDMNTGRGYNGANKRKFANHA